MNDYFSPIQGFKSFRPEPKFGLKSALAAEMHAFKPMAAAHIQKTKRFAFFVAF
jgi:hypothetical protein